MFPVRNHSAEVQKQINSGMPQHTATIVLDNTLKKCGPCPGFQKRCLFLLPITGMNYPATGTWPFPKDIISLYYFMVMSLKKNSGECKQVRQAGITILPLRCCRNLTQAVQLFHGAKTCSINARALDIMNWMTALDGLKTITGLFF